MHIAFPTEPLSIHTPNFTDTLRFSGQLDLEVKATPGTPMRISVEAETVRVRGIGDNTGQVFRVSGEAEFNFRVAPTNPVSPINVGGGFRVRATAVGRFLPQEPFIPVRVAFLLTLNSTGQVTAVRASLPDAGE